MQIKFCWWIQLLVKTNNPSGITEIIVAKKQTWEKRCRACCRSLRYLSIHERSEGSVKDLNKVLMFVFMAIGAALVKWGATWLDLNIYHSSVMRCSLLNWTHARFHYQHTAQVGLLSLITTKANWESARLNFVKWCEEQVALIGEFGAVLGVGREPITFKTQ